MAVRGRALVSGWSTNPEGQMADLWQEEGFAGAAAGDGSDDDWDEGEESTDLSLEDGFDDPDSPEDDDEGWGDEGEA
jgi:hypothetical protein